MAGFLFFLVALTMIACRLVSAADVFAHFMVQNAYAYDVHQWKTDMRAAQQMNVDGFALNWVPPDCEEGLSWTADRIGDAYTAAEALGFRLIQSFDMSYTECIIFWNQTYMESVLSKYAESSATYRWNGKILVSTYGGDQVEQYGNDFFQGLKDGMQYSHNITLAPALTTYSMEAQTRPSLAANQLISDYPSIDGFLNWQAWPLNVHKNMSAVPDKTLQAALEKAGRTGPYIMAVSPWQYKDLDNGDPLDAWVAYSDTLFPDRFRSLVIEDAIQPDIIELLTWNDFCESHYLRDLPSQDESATDFVELGDMAGYVFGQNHAPWRIIAKYYLKWWKTGKAPKIDMDQAIYWYRVHPKATICTGGSSTVIRNHKFPADAVFAWALVKEPANISLSVGGNQYWTFEADGTGPVMGMVPFPLYVPEDGVTPEVAIMRDGRTVQYSNGSQPISSACAWQNFNPVVNLVGHGVNSGF